MSTTGIIVITIGILICCCSFFMLRRNDQVYAFRQILLEKIHAGAMDDIDHGRDWLWRHEAYNMVSYNVMYNKFWLKLIPESFWKDTSFLEIKEATCQNY